MTHVRRFARQAANVLNHRATAIGVELAALAFGLGSDPGDARAALGVLLAAIAERERPTKP